MEMDHKKMKQKNGKHDKRLPQLETVNIGMPKANKTPFTKYRGKFKTSFWSIILGMLLVVVGFVVVGYSEGVREEANIIKRLHLTTIDQLKGNEDGMIKIIGKPRAQVRLIVEDSEYKDMVFHNIITEKLDGDNWVQIKSSKSWIDFKFGDIQIIPSDAEIIFDYKIENIINEYEEVEDGETVKYREILYGVALDENLIVIGEVKDQAISGGGKFIITNKSHKDLINLFVDSNSFVWWGCKIGALLLLVLGVVSFLLPIISFLDIFPAFGWGFVSIITLIAIIINTIVIFFITIMLTFWWLIGLLVLFVLSLIVKIKSREKELPNSLIS